MLGLRKQQGNSETIPIWVCTTERRQYGEAIRDGVGSMAPSSAPVWLAAGDTNMR